MPCNKGHNECIGPECTRKVGPKRPPIGIARERAEIVTAFAAFHGGYLQRQIATTTEYTFYRHDNAVEAYRQAYRLSLDYPKWGFKVKLESLPTSGVHTLTITYKRIKD